MSIEALRGPLTASPGSPERAWQAGYNKGVSDALSVLERVPEDSELIELLAETLSWASGEMKRYNPGAHSDHNRWSWQGDGHGQAIRDEFRNQAAHLARALRGGA